MTPVTAVAQPNIALIKYWGNRDDALRLPAADSLSMTLDHPSVEITVDHSPALAVRSFGSDGTERALNEKMTARFATHLELTKRYLATLGSNAIPESVSVTVRSAIPQSIGLASSAAVFGCLAKAYAGLIAPKVNLTLEQQSVIGRLGSGSAARSLFGGFAALDAGEGGDIGASQARAIADEAHWSLHDFVIIPSVEEKKVGSTEGHAVAWTSPLYEARLEAIRTRRQRECVDAILRRDFEKLRSVTEDDALDMHRVMETSAPPLRYLTETTHAIRLGIEELRRGEHLELLYTMDAGPTVHLLCTDASRERAAAFAKAQKGCTIFETSIGPGARLVS